MAGTGNNAYQQVATGMQNAGTGLQSGIISPIFVDYLKS